MNKVEKAVLNHFENVFCIKNKYGVGIYMNSDNSFSAGCAVPGFIYPTRKYVIELFILFENVNELVEKFTITAPDDLYKIKPEFLNVLYEKGDASISCMMNDKRSFSLTFRKFGSSLIATDDIEENTHTVAPYLKTQAEFYNYTVHFYKNVYKKQQKLLQELVTKTRI